jgi:hypothetical protein
MLEGLDKFLFSVHIVQIVVGIGMSALMIGLVPSVPVWMIVVGILILSTGVLGCYLLSRGNSLAYSLLIMFNLPQVVWVTTPKTRYGFQFGLDATVALSGPASHISLNFAAVILIVLSFKAWRNSRKSLAEIGEA